MYISLDGEQRVKDKENFYWDPGFTENRATHSEGQRSGSQGLAFGFSIERTPQTSKHGKEKWPGNILGGSNQEEVSKKTILSNSYRFYPD